MDKRQTWSLFVPTGGKRTHKPHSHSKFCRSYHLYDLPHEPGFEGGTNGSCVFTLAVVEMHRDAWTCEMTDGNEVEAISREKLTRPYMTVRPRSRATRSALLFCAHLNHADNRWRVYNGNTITCNAREGYQAVKIVKG